MKSSRGKPRLLLLQNYLAVIKASVGSQMFRRLYFKVGRKKIDVLRDGDLSCAFFVSTILKLFGLISEIHTTVAGTVEEMKRTGWKKIPVKGRSASGGKLEVGCIVVWAAKRQPPSWEPHKHIGFYIGNGRVISNDYRKKSPQIRAVNYRATESFWWHKKLK